MKRKTIITSVLVIVLCLGLISGSTFALFTSESSVNIAVTSGKVNVVATIDDTSLKVYSATVDPTGLSQEELADVAGTLTGTFAGTYYYDKLDGTTFTNGGTVTLTDTKTLKIDKITPGDKVEVTVSVENNSNVKTNYRIRVNVLDGETLEEQAKSLKLFEGLTVNVGTNDAEPRTATKLNGVIRVSDWYDLAARGDSDNLADIPVEIFLPLEAGNEYQDLKTEIQITVEAVQNNAATNTELETINAFLANQTPTTMNAAVKSLADNSVLGLTSYAAAFAKVESYLWNVDTNQFYAESDATDFAYKYFKVYKSMPTDQTYSIYAYDDGTTSWANQNVNVVVGFDAGETTGITSVTYNRSTAEYGQDVVIRTNSAGTTLTINAPKDTVKHYDAVGSLNIIAVAGSSYHEFGQVAFVEITNGRLALEKDSQVSRVHFASTVVEQGQPTEDKVFNEIIVSYDSSLDNNLPKFSRDDVDIPTQGKLVVELQKVDNTQPEPETTSDFIWLTKQGIFEQIKVSGEGDKISEDAKWADDNEVGDDTQKAAQQIANNIGRDGNGNINVEVTVTETNTSETKTYEVALNENRDLVVIESGSTSTETPVATISESGNITVGSQDYNIALTNNNENTTELVVSTTGDNPEVVTKVDAVKTSGLSETKKEEVKTEVVEEAVIEELGNDVNNIARIKAKVYTTLKAALDDAVDGDVVVLLQDRIGSNKEANLSINKNITLDLGNKVLETKKLTVYSLDNLIIKNGTINGQLRIGEHQSTKVKYKTDGSYMTGYHPLAPAKNVILNNITINSGNDVALYFTNIEDDLTRANSSNPVDRDLYGKYIYKTGYTSLAQYNAHNYDEVFTACTDKDKVTIINCNINSNKTITGNMHEENKRVFTVIEDGRLYTEVLDVQSGTFNNDSLGRFISEGKYLVGIESGKFVVQENAPETYTAKINNVYYTYEGGANDAITYANLGETVYIKENANVEKTIGRNQSITLVYEADNIGYTGATPILKYELKSNKNDNVEVFYTDYEPVAEVYKTTNNTISPSMTSSNLVGTYPTVAEAFAAANINGQFSCVRLVDDYEGGDDAKYYYTDTAYSAGAHSGSSVRFDLNGYTWTYTGTNKALVITTTSGSSAKDTIIVDTSSGKTGQILAPNGTCIYKENSSTENTRIQSGTFIAKNQAVNINKLSASKKSGKWYIEGGTFQSTTGAAISLGWSDSSGLLEISGGTFISGGTAKTITASSNNSPSVTLKGGTYNTDPTTYGTKFSIASGKSAVDNGDGTWTIK